MPFTTLLSEPVTIHQRQPQAQGDYSDEVLVEVGQVQTYGMMRPLGGNEVLLAQNTEIRRATLFLDGSESITAMDQVDIAGVTWEVSDVDVWVNPRTAQVHHLEVQVQLTEG